MEFEMVKFDVKEAEIAKMKTEYMALKITGLNDVAGYTLVHEARMIMVRLRGDITRAGKAWRDQVNVHINKELTEEKRLLGLIKPIETHLEKEQFAIDDEKKRIKALAEEQERKRVQSLINRLFAFGCKFDGTDYQYQDILIPATAIPGMTEQEFESICARIESAIEKEIAEQEEELRKRQEEDKRQAVERDRLAAIAREQAAKEADMKAESDRIAKESVEKLAAIARTESTLEADKRKLEEEKHKFEEEKRLEVAKKEAAEKARIETEARLKREAEEKTLTEKHAKEEAARQEALKPDKIKLLEYAYQVREFRGPEINTLPAIGILDQVWPKLQAISDFIETEVKKL